jgi:acyl carrier protein
MAGADSGRPAGQEDVIGVLIEIISGICGIDESELTADRQVADLGIDSLMAGEIIAQAEMALHADIDIQRLSDDWSGLTVGRLATQLTAEIRADP